MSIIDLSKDNPVIPGLSYRKTLISNLNLTAGQEYTIDESDREEIDVSCDIVYTFSLEANPPPGYKGGIEIYFESKYGDSWVQDISVQIPITENLPSNHTRFFINAPLIRIQKIKNLSDTDSVTINNLYLTWKDLPFPPEIPALNIYRKDIPEMTISGSGGDYYFTDHLPDFSEVNYLVQATVGVPWEAKTVYSAGDQRRPTTRNGYFYKAQNDGTSGPNEPVWPTTLGSTVDDDNGIPTWAASTSCSIGDAVIPSTANGCWYECTVAGTSGPNEPAWTTTPGDTVDDDNGIAAWAASTSYSVGDAVVPTTANGYWYECTTAGTSDSTEPTWSTTPGDTITDGSVVWTCRKIVTWTCKKIITWECVNNASFSIKAQATFNRVDYYDIPFTRNGSWSISTTFSDGDDNVLITVKNIGNYIRLTIIPDGANDITLTIKENAQLL